MKICKSKKCLIKTPQPLTNFNKNKNFEDGFSNRCRVCNNKCVVESTNKNKDYYKQKMSEWGKKWRKENPQKQKEIGGKWNKKLLENGYFKDYYQKNKERLQIREKQPHIIQKRKDRWKERYYNDVEFRLKEINKSNFHLFFKDKG